MVQEALTNARRHSGAKNVRVNLCIEGEELVIEVADDGRGFGPGVGLSSMRERVASLGGKLEVESEVGGGTTVRLRVPRPEFTQRTAEEGSTRFATSGRERDGGEA